MAVLIALSKAQEMAKTGLYVGKGIFFLIVFICSIVVLAGASNSKSTGKGKGVLGLSVILFLATLVLPFLARLHMDTNSKVVSVMIGYWVLALIITILAYQNSAELKAQNSDELKKSDDAKRAATGIVVMIGLYLLIGAVLFHTGDMVSRGWVKDNYFLAP